MRVSRLLCSVSRLFVYLFVSALLFVLGILLHEWGHGLLVLHFGAHVEKVDIIGVQVWPTFVWDAQSDAFGRLWWYGDLTPAQYEWVRLGGNLATMSISLVALPVFLFTPGTTRSSVKKTPRRASRAVKGHAPAIPLLTSCFRTALLTLSLFFLDTLSHTLPTLGIPMFLFFGKRDPELVSEGYLAATSLGCPGWLFQVAIVGYSLLAMGAIAYKLIHERRAAPTSECSY